jgi:uncharacterized protein YecT (DUF1311 family)
MLVGWPLVLLALGIIVAPVPSEVSLLLSFMLSWIGFTMVFPGASVIFRAGKGLVGAAVVSFAVFYLGDMVSSHSQQPTADAKRVDLGSLLRAYEQNEVGADQQYKGRVIETNGVLFTIKKDIGNTPFVLVSTDGQFAVPSLQCSLSSVGASQAAAMSPGRRVVLQGKVAGLMLNVQAQDCIFVTTPANTPAAGATATGATATLPASAARMVVPETPEPVAAAVPASALPESAPAAAGPSLGEPQDTSATADDPQPAGDPACPGVDVATTQGQVDCYRAQLDAADGELNAVYRQLMLSLPEERTVPLRTEQREWIKTRDSSCEKEAQEEGGGGSLGRVVWVACLHEATASRVVQLKAYPAR